MDFFKSNKKYSLFSKSMSYIEGFLFNSQIKKTRKYKKLPFPEFIGIGPTDICNHACIMCPNKFLDKKKQGFMSEEVFDKILNETIENKKYCKRIGFGLFGEPTAHPKIKTFLKKAKDAGFVVTFGTNGSLLNKDFADFIVENKIDEVRISFYAHSKESYSKIQGHHPASYNPTLDNINHIIKKARNSNTKTMINFISMKYNQGNWKKYFNQFEKSPNNVFGFARLHDWERIYVKRKITKESLFPKLTYFKPCQQIETNIDVDWNGDIKACCYAWDIDSLNLGNIKDHSIKDLWLGKQFLSLKKSHETGESVNFPDCGNCGAHKFKMDVVDTARFYFLKKKMEKYVKKFQK